MARTAYTPAVYYPPQGQAAQRGWSTKDIVVTALAGIVVLGTGVYFVNRHFKKKKQDKTYRLTAEAGSPAYYAQMLKIAFDNDAWLGMGTDEATIREAFQKMPSQDFYKQVAAAYYDLTSGKMTLEEKLEDELSSTELREIKAILEAKPARANEKAPVATSALYNSWAVRLKAAFDYSSFGIPGTDNEAVIAVLHEMPNQAAFYATAKIFQSLYHKDMLAELKDELTDNGWGGNTKYLEALSIISKKPKA
jgi:hypothetical protein